MSGDEPGYVPPDHKTTAEFGIRGGAAAPEAAAVESETTFVDEPVDDAFDSGATLQDPEVSFGAAPVDDPEDDDPSFGDDVEDDWEVTLEDPRLDDAEPTVTDFPAGRPRASVTASDIPVPFNPAASTPPEAIEFEMPAPVYGQEVVPERDGLSGHGQGTVPEPGAPEPVDSEPVVFGQAPPPEDSVPMYEQPPAERGEAGDRHITPPGTSAREAGPEPAAGPHVPAAAPLASPPPPAGGEYAAASTSGEAPWTEQFSAESESTIPGGADPAFASAMQAPPVAPHESPLHGPSPHEPSPQEPSPQGPPPQGPPPHEPSPHGTPPPMLPSAASPSGGLPPDARGGSRRSLVLAALAAGVVLLAATGVVVLFFVGGPEERPTAGGSPAASVPATGGGGNPAPTASGGPTGSGAPAAPPSAGPSGGPPSAPPGQQPASPPAPTAPVGPVQQGNGITYQLTKQDEGYFEGHLVITNRTGTPMNTWKLAFTTPGAVVKNVWGAKIVKRGELVELANLDGAAAIQPGATWDIRFGASGPKTDPQACWLNGKACGF